MMKFFRYKRIIFILLLIFLQAVCVFVCFWLSKPRKYNAGQPEITERNGDLIVKFLEHPPWAKLHVNSVAINGNRIELSQYYIIYTLSNDYIRNHHEIILNGIPDGEYTIIHDQVSKTVTLGTVKFHNGKATFVKNAQ